VLDLIILMILIDRRVFGIEVVDECTGEDPLDISFRLRLILHIPLTIGIFPMAPRHHLLLMALQIITGVVLVVGVVLDHPEVVPHQVGWRGAEGDIMMAPRMVEEELCQDPLHLIGMSLWIWSKMVSRLHFYVCYKLFLSLFFKKHFQDHFPLTTISPHLMAPRPHLQICSPHLDLGGMGLPLLIILLMKVTCLCCLVSLSTLVSLEARVVIIQQLLLLPVPVLDLAPALALALVLVPVWKVELWEQG
jgi:hypothetical protein